MTSDAVVPGRNHHTFSVREIFKSVLQKRPHVSEKKEKERSFKLVCTEGQHVKCVTLNVTLHVLYNESLNNSLY